MKAITALCVSVALLSMIPAAARSRNIRSLGGDKYTVSSGDVTMTVDAASGGKILSFQLDGREVISQLTFPNAFGSTFWTSPQNEWRWPPVPEYDSMPYTARLKGGKLILDGQTSGKYQYCISKEFSVDRKDGAVVVTYSITNKADRPRSVAPWEITRVPGAGEIFFDAPVDGITPAGLLPFRAEHGLSWYAFESAPQNRKINADGKGWLAYANDGLLLVKKFQDLTPSQPAPEEAEIQVYVNAGQTYIELESQGAYTELAPGKSLSWTVRWYLLPAAGDSEALVGAVRKLLE